MDNRTHVFMRHRLKHHQPYKNLHSELCKELGLHRYTARKKKTAGSCNQQINGALVVSKWIYTVPLCLVIVYILYICYVPIAIICYMHESTNHLFLNVSNTVYTVVCILYYEHAPTNHNTNLLTSY